MKPLRQIWSVTRAGCLMGTMEQRFINKMALIKESGVVFNLLFANRRQMSYFAQNSLYYD